ncbi:MAG: DUF5057 domain-containing protein [Blautia sp.]|nr:DUF5057 domain-containing protein [Blautia sp.]
MKRRNIKIISIVLCICLLGGLLYQSGAFEALGTALNIGTTQPSELKPKTDKNAELGTEGNPFTVLEIVPSHEEAQFGYFIPGCEPVDMELAKYTEAAKGDFQSALGSVYDISDKKQYAFYDQIPVNSVLTINTWDNRFKTRNDLNYTDKWTNYGQWRTEYNNDYSQKGYYVQEEGGGFQKNGENYSYVGEGAGEYRWVASEDGNFVRKPNGDLFAYSYIEYKHKDEFIQRTFNGAKSTSFQSQVITMTPSELESNLNLIDDADLIYIHPGSGNYSGIANIYYQLNKNGDTTEYTEDGNGNKTFKIPKDGPSFWDPGNDLTYNEVIQITKRMASDKPAALMLDKANMFAGNNDRKEYNCHKLLYMVLMYKPQTFWNYFGAYLQPYTGADGTTKVEYTKGGKEGAYPTSRFWGISESCDPWTYKGSTYTNTTTPFLFHPETGACLIDDVRYYNIGGGGNDVFDKIFTYQGDQATLQQLLTGGNITESGMDKDGLWTNNSTVDAFVDRDGNSMSFLDAIEFILEQPSYTPKLRILEVQPCDQYIYGSDGWKDYYQALFPWYHPKSSKNNSWLEDSSLIEVTTMPTWEFIGSTGRYDYGELDDTGNLVRLTTESSDDLTAKYDMIIFGSKQDESNGKTGYNKYSYGVDLGRLVYTSIGGTLTDNPNRQIEGIRLSTNLDMRYAGNDITLKKLLECEDFLRAGKPIVVDEGLYAGNQVDTSKVDRDSKIYDLLTYSGIGHENLFVHDSIESAKMKSLISQNVCRLEFYEEGYPIEYTYSEVDKNYGGGMARGVINHEVYHAKESDNTAVLEYHFYIYGNAADTYNVYLNLDLDGDGVYSGSLKQLNEVYNMNDAEPESPHTVDTSEPALGMNIYDANRNLLGTTDPKNPSGSFALQANTEYYATRVIPSSQQGIIPWKLEVQSRTNSYLRSSAIDYTAVFNSEKDGILVLQMNLSKDMKTDRVGTSFTKDRIVVKNGESYSAFDTRRIAYDKDGAPETTASLDNATAKKFRTYLDPVNEFDVTIQFLYNSDWRKLFNTNEPYEVKLANWEAFLTNYDMLVFGFIDSCEFTENQVFAEGLKDYIAQGKSVIFSHDTVYGSDAYYTGHSYLYNNYTSWLRTMAGQRRSYYNKQSDGTYEKSYTDVKSNGTTVTFASQSNLNNGSYRQYFKQLSQDVDGDTVYSRFWGTYVNDWADNSNFLYLRTLVNYTNYKTDRVTKDNWLNRNGWTNGAVTSYVKMTNNGQITTYPYHINDTIEVLTSHLQYYQLDLEYLEEGDVNVWFNLSDTKDDQVRAYLKESGKGNGKNTSTNLYSARDQDCRNSFFIYNKGNITYTGSGHTTGTVMPDDEVKLFVNTMIAAYRQPESQPYAAIDNADTTAVSGTSVLYLDYDGYQYQSTPDPDDENAPALPGPVKNGLDSRVVTINGRVMVGIEFSIHDKGGTNQLTNKKCYMRLYHDGTAIDENNVIVRKLEKDAEGNSVIGDIIPLEGKETLQPYYSVDADDTDAGVRYIMYVPYEDVTDGDGISDYSIGTYATYTKSKRFVTTSTKTTNAEVMLLPLFNLN